MGFALVGLHGPPRLVVEKPSDCDRAHHLCPPVPRSVPALGPAVVHACIEHAKLVTKEPIGVHEHEEQPSNLLRE